MAHDIAQIDPITKVPMGAKVCYGFKGLPFNFQEDTFGDIMKYLNGGMGPLLSVLCSFVWFTHVRPAADWSRVHSAGSRPADSQVVREFASSLTLTWAVAHLRGPTTSFSKAGKLISVSPARLVCFLVVQGIRITICAALCYGGSKFIGFTISLKDLILNCIALTVSRCLTHGVALLFCEARFATAAR